MPVKGTPLHVPPCLFFISGCSPFKVASGRALASAVRNTYCGQGFSAHQGRQSSAYARSIRARHWAPRVSAGYPECFESISKKASPFPAKAGNRDSIRSKVFERDREGFGEGKGCLSRERHPFPSPNPSLSLSKTFDLIESLFPAFAGNGEAFFEMDSKHSGYPADTRGAQ